MSSEGIDGGKSSKDVDINENSSSLIVVSFKQCISLSFNQFIIHILSSKGADGKIRLPTYSMKQDNHGLVWNVNFENFKHDEDKKRKGSQYDVKKLSSLFCEARSQHTSISFWVNIVFRRQQT